MTLDLEKLATESPLLHGNGLIPIGEAAHAIGLSALSLVNELRNDRVPIFVHAQHWHGWLVHDWSQVEIDQDGRFVLNSVEALGERHVLTGIVRANDSVAALSSLLVEGHAVESIFHLKGLEAFWIDNEQPIPLSAWMAHIP